MSDPRFPRPWSSERQPFETPHFSLQIEMALAVQDKAMYFRCESTSNIEALVRGVAKFLPPRVHGFILRTDNVSNEEAEKLVAPLMAGETVVLGYEGPSDLPGAIHDHWLECAKYPDNTTYVYENFVLQAVENPGFLATVHILNEQSGWIGYKAPICRVPPNEVSSLELLGQLSLLHVTHMG